MSQEELQMSSSNKRPRNLEESSRPRNRPKLSPFDSSASEPSASDDSALIPTSVPDDSTNASEVDSDGESEISDSSEEPSSDSSSDEDSEPESETESASDVASADNEDGVIKLRANRGKKPRMKISKAELGPDLRPFLKDFLPQLKAANDELEAAKLAGTLKDKTIEEDGEDQDDGERQYIEMDLGLGVLEEREPNADGDSASSESESDDDGANTPKQKDIMAKLMGRKTENEKAGIQEVANVPET